MCRQGTGGVRLSQSGWARGSCTTGRSSQSSSCSRRRAAMRSLSQIWGGKRRRWMSLRELMASGRATIMTTDEGPRSTDDLEIASVVLANLSGQQLAKIIETARHVRELLYGYRSGSAEMAEEGEPRPQYLPTVPLGHRYCAKADELNVDKRTVQRWVAAYLEHGEAGLSSVHQRNPLGRTDRRWINTAMEIMVDHGLRSRPNGKRASCSRPAHDWPCSTETV